MLSTTTKQVIVFIQLVVIMLCSFGLINLPGSLQSDIQQQFKIDTSKYGLLFSVCNWAALIDIVHGYLLDRYLGIKLASIIYCITVLIGSVIFCIAGFTKSFWLLLVGRTIYGFGINPIMLLTNKHIINWFSSGNYINLVYSVNESILWLGSSVCYFVSVNLLKSLEISRSTSQSLALTISIETTILCVLAIISTLVLAYMKADEDGSNNAWQENSTENKSLTWKDYLTLPWLFWIYSITIFIYFISILSFLSMSQVFFKETYHMGTSKASNLSGLITIVAFFLSPPFGWLLDKIGHNLTCLTFAFLLNIISHTIFTFTKWDPLIPVILMAVSIVLSSSLWSQFQYLVAEHQYMIAYGVAQTGLNGALAVGTLISGYLIDKHGYEGFMKYLLILIVCALPALLLVWILNHRQGNILNKTPKKKMEYLGRNQTYA